MGLLDRFAALFARADVPDEAKRVFDRAQTSRELLHGLDDLMTVNQTEFKDLERELGKLEQHEREEILRARESPEGSRGRRNALLSIQRLRKQMDNFEARLRIFDRNMNLHLNLIGKIQEIEAMKLRGVDESRIDKIVLEFEENLEKYDETMAAGEAAHTTTRKSAQEERELLALEKELVGEPPARPVLEPVPKPAVTEAPKRSVEDLLREPPPPVKQEPPKKVGDKEMDFDEKMLDLE